MLNIKDFRSSINDQGILRPNKYMVQFSMPEYLKGFYNGEDLKLLSLRCESVNIPGFNFASKDGPPAFGYGPIEKHPYVPGFDGVTFTFLLDSKNKIYKFFYDWTMKIVNYDGRGGTNMRSNSVDWKPYEVGYKSQYQSNIFIQVFDGNKNTKNNSDVGNRVMNIALYSAFPMGLPSSQLAWESSDVMRISVPFSFTDFGISIPN